MPRHKHPILHRLLHRAGFTLLDVTIALAVVALVAAAATPVMLRQAQIRQAERTAEEMLLIGDAAKFWYKDHDDTWPPSIEAMKDEGYLPSAFSGVSPFGTNYATTAGSPNFRVGVELPADLATAISTKLPLSSVASGGGSTSTAEYEMPPPGASADQTGLVQEVVATYAPTQDTLNTWWTNTGLVGSITPRFDDSVIEATAYLPHAYTYSSQCEYRIGHFRIRNETDNADSDRVVIGARSAPSSGIGYIHTPALVNMRYTVDSTAPRTFRVQFMSDTSCAAVGTGSTTKTLILREIKQ